MVDVYVATTCKESELLTKLGIVPESCCPFAIKTHISVLFTDRAGSEPDILSSHIVKCWFIVQKLSHRFSEKSTLVKFGILSKRSDDIDPLI